MAKITTETKWYRLMGMTSLLGSQPSSESVRTNYLLAKHPEIDASGEIVPTDTDELGLTVFFRDQADHIVLMDYQIKGFFKATMLALKADLNIMQPAKKCDQFLFISPRCVPILKDGEPVMDEDGILERPLRGQTMQGERISLVSSEMIEAPWSIDFGVTVLANSATSKSSALTMEAVEAALDYGKYSGIGQWRNGGHGRFEWEEIKR